MAIARRLRDSSAIPDHHADRRARRSRPSHGAGIGRRRLSHQAIQSPRAPGAHSVRLLRRSKTAAPAQARQREIRAYRFADFEFNLRTRRLTRQPGQVIELTNREFNLLAALLGAPGRVLTRDQLLEASRLYDNEVYDRSIDVLVLRLRRKIEAEPSQPAFIVTERGTGYSFMSSVDIVY